MPRHAASCAKPYAGLHVKLRADPSTTIPAYKRSYLLQGNMARRAAKRSCTIITWLLHHVSMAFLLQACLAGAAITPA